MKNTIINNKNRNTFKSGQGENFVFRQNKTILNFSLPVQKKACQGMATILRKEKYVSNQGHSTVS